MTTMTTMVARVTTMLADQTVVLDVPRVPSLATHHKVVQGVHRATTHRLQAKTNDNVHLRQRRL